MAHQLGKAAWFVMIGIVVTALSGCGGGGEEGVEMPPPTVSLPENHALSGSFRLPAGQSQGSGNVVITCPAGGQACELTIESDDTATYEGGRPTITPAEANVALPDNHDVGAGGISIDADESEQRGNVVISCPAGGPDCVVVVALDGAAVYQKTGGRPTVMPARASLNLPQDHGLGAGAIPVAPGASEQRGNVVVSCPAGGPACEVRVAQDGAATYLQTGGAPTVTSVRADLDLPDNHGLGAGRFAIAPGASQRSGNIEFSCPASGPACTVSVESDGTAIYEGGRPTVVPTRAALILPANHGLGAGGITIAPGASQRSGNIEFSCPAGGPACEVVVASDGSAESLQTGGIPSIMAATAALILPANHGLGAGGITVAPGASQKSGNIEIACPAGGPVCEVRVASDGSVSYLATGGLPTIMAATANLNLPANHGLGVGGITVAPGASQRSGNVEFSCPAGGLACEVRVASDGSAVYLETGGVPAVMSAQLPLELPDNHGLNAGVILLEAGMSVQRGNLEFLCPAGGPACEVVVAADGSATYLQTGGMPTAMAALERFAVPDNHGLAVGGLTVTPDNSEERGNVVIACPAGGPACEVTVASDGTVTYLETGGVPTVVAAREPFAVPANHGLTAGDLMIAPGSSETRGNVVIACPAGGPACEVIVDANGMAQVLKTGATPTVTPAQATLGLPANHDLSAGGITVAPGTSQKSGNVEFSCPVGGPACEVRVASDGNAIYLETGGTPTVMATQATFDLPANHGLSAGGITIAPGTSQKSGNVEFSCPVGGPACEVRVASDGSAAYLETGGMPSIMSAQATFDLPVNHGLAAGVIPIAAGTSEERGNVVITCPAGGPTCELIVGQDGSATYPETGGMPTVMTAQATFDLPINHGLAAGVIPVAAGTSEERGNVVITCPAGGLTCELIVGQDGTVTYPETGGVPTVMAAQATFDLPANHDVAVGNLTITPGVSEERGNVVITCPAGGPACEVRVASDGNAIYLRTGGMPTVMVAQGTFDLPANHGLAAGVIPIAAGTSEERGNVIITCPAGGPTCEVVVGADGTATYPETGGMPSATAVRLPLMLPDNHAVNAEVIPVAPGTSEERGNVVITCPAGGLACEVVVASDGTAAYLQTGAVPSVMPARAALSLPANHGFAAGDLTVASGTSEQRGNVDVTCPASGSACAIIVAADGSAVYLETGGTPTVMATRVDLADLPTGSLDAGTLTINPGDAHYQRGVTIECQAILACEVEVAADGSAIYLQTGGVPEVLTHELAWALNGPEPDRASNVFKRDTARDAADSAFDYLQTTSDDLGLNGVMHNDDGFTFTLDIITGGGDLYDALDGMNPGDHGRDSALPSLGEGWTGVALARSGAGQRTTTHVNVYSDIEKEISADENNPVEFSGAALNSHPIVETDAREDLYDERIDFFDINQGFEGTFDGVAGYFTCADSSGCVINPEQNRFVFQDQQWTFQPDGSATFTVTDEDYLSLGVWLTVPEKTDLNPDVLIGSFATGSQPFASALAIEEIVGNASYRGKAVGLYEKRSIQDVRIGSFTANANLQARFGTTTSAGTISGTIDTFVEGGQTLGDWYVELERAGLTDTAYTAGAAIISNLYSPLKSAGRWVAKPYGPGVTNADPPSTLAGWFESEAGLRDAGSEYLSLTGAFGAHHQ